MIIISILRTHSESTRITFTCLRTPQIGYASKTVQATVTEVNLISTVAATCGKLESPSKLLNPIPLPVTTLILAVQPHCLLILCFVILLLVFDTPNRYVGCNTFHASDRNLFTQSASNAQHCFRPHCSLTVQSLSLLGLSTTVVFWCFCENNKKNTNNK